jgi:hypothetical protein
MSDDNRPTGLYVKYLQRLHDQREQAGLPPTEDICPESYWRERRQNEEEKNARR